MRLLLTAGLILFLYFRTHQNVILWEKKANTAINPPPHQNEFSVYS
jgi:hypothetical protein